MITFVVSDPKRYTTSPTWWNNFSQETWKSVTNIRHDYHAVRNMELTKYGGVFYSDSEDGSKKLVSFESDKDATFFILRWS